MSDDLANAGGAQSPAPSTDVQADATAPNPQGNDQQVEGESQQKPEGNKEADPEKLRRRSRRSERINELTRESNDYRRQAEFYRAQFEELSAKKMKPLDPVQHSTDDEWGAAIAENASIKSQEGVAKAQAEIAATRAEALEVEVWNERVAQYEEIVPDFQQVVYGFRGEVPEHLLKVIRGMANGPPAAYYLAKNPREIARLSQLSPTQAAFELGRLDKTLAATKPRVVSKTPNPPKTVVGRSGATTVPVDQMTPQQYRAWKAARQK